MRERGASTWEVGALAALVAIFSACSEAHTANLDACAAPGCGAADTFTPPPAPDAASPLDAPPTDSPRPGDTGPTLWCTPLIDYGASTSPGPGACNGWGRTGAPCRTGACVSGTTCIDPATFGAASVQGVLGLSQGDASDPAHPGYARVQSPADACDAAPLDAFAGTFCAQQCDTSAASDTCGACTTCSNVVTQMPLIATYGGVTAFLGATAMFGVSTGVCRLDCTWSPTDRGSECLDASTTCDALANVCIEACRSDNECNTTSGTTYEGARVTLLVTDHPARCNGVTGRCEVSGTPGAMLGTACTSNDDCAPGVGICLPGGRCAELGCTNPGTTTSMCGPGGAGVCLDTSAAAHPSSLCLLGCNATADCGAGNTCQMFGMGISIGSHLGYCIGVCTSDDECAPSETCTDQDATTTATPTAQCVPRCMHVGAVGTGAAGDCATSEFCSADHAGASYGWCRPLGGFCGASNTYALTPAAATDCATTQICDETLATPHGPGGSLVRELVGDGHCVPPCITTADCASYSTGSVCVTTGPLAGLCRVPCAAAASPCPLDQVCDITLASCVEVAAPM